jgi:alpha-glucosidase
VAAAEGRESVSQRSGHFTVEDEILRELPDQTLERVEPDGDSLTFSGRLSGGREGAGYRIFFEPASGERLRFRAEVEEPYNRLYLTYTAAADEDFFGFGMQYSHFDMKGRKVPIFIQEQGIGRGAQPITLGAELQAGAGGDWHTSYACVPHYITGELRSLFLENYEYSAFDLRRDDRVQVEVFSSRMSGQVLAGETPVDLIRIYTGYAGRMRPLPEWLTGGAVVGMQGGTERVLEVLERLEALDTPLAAFWLQDWVGQRQTFFGSQLWWNWELDRELYPEWESLVERLEEAGARTLLYLSPFLADAADKPNARRNLFREAAESGYLVRDRAGEPYMVEITDFSAALLDLTNPEARAWIKEIIRETLLGLGASGWMADFGEGLPYDAVLTSGESAASYHNRYAEEWARVNREAIREAGREEDAVFFTRSAFTRSPGESTLFWLGDQLVSWDEHDGIKTAVVGLLTSGISGFSFNHSDIGGYTAITHPVHNYHRSKELLLRWIEMNAFTAVFRTHEGNRPEANHQIYTDDATLEHFSRFARVYAALEPYRRGLVREAAETGLPVVRHPFIHYWRDPEVVRLEHQFMLGPELMVAPVLDPGEEEVEIYLPEGEWTHLWSQRTFLSGAEGRYLRVAAPIGEPAVFYPAGSEAGDALRRELARLGILAG